MQLVFRIFRTNKINPSKPENMATKTNCYIFPSKTKPDGDVLTRHHFASKPVRNPPSNFLAIIDQHAKKTARRHNKCSVSGTIFGEPQTDKKSLNRLQRSVCKQLTAGAGTGLFRNWKVSAVFEDLRDRKQVAYSSSTLKCPKVAFVRWVLFIMIFFMADQRNIKINPVLGKCTFSF